MRPHPAALASASAGGASCAAAGAALGPSRSWLRLISIMRWPMSVSASPTAAADWPVGSADASAAAHAASSSADGVLLAMRSAMTASGGNAAFFFGEAIAGLPCSEALVPLASGASACASGMGADVCSGCCASLAMPEKGCHKLRWPQVSSPLRLVGLPAPHVGVEH